ncbi:MAG TPA: hypothetical protein VIC27_09460, partial [Ktedonobacterales bacterium]
ASGAGGAAAPAPRTAAGAANGNGSVPDWLATRNGSQRPEDGPTAPVPSVAPRWNDSNGYGGQQQGQPAQGSDQDDKGGRNIFRIFSN